MNWLAAAGRLAVVAGAGAGIGWHYGQPLLGFVLALLLAIAVWLYQLLRVQSWLRDPDQPPPEIYGIWGDLLARIHRQQRQHVEIQERLQANLDYLRDSFTSMRDGVVMVDESGAIKWSNLAAESLLGLRYPEDRGQALTNLVRVPAFNQYVLAGDYSQPLQYSTSGMKPLYLRVEITRFGEGDRLLFVRDVSESVRLERIRRDFVANVSHELRTPLTVITGYLDTMLASEADLPQRYGKPLRQMSQQARRMENLLRDLLWLSRIESGPREARYELVDVRGLLQELREELAGTCPDRPIELDLATHHKIHGDYRELYSAVSNLANNAIKYSPPGSAVTIRWYSQENHCIVEVQDRGIGIEAEHIPRLTERFYRVDDSRSSTTGGTGLGLAIVKHVLAAHGGELQIDSEPGVGSTFTLRFPVGG